MRFDVRSRSPTLVKASSAYLREYLRSFGEHIRVEHRVAADGKRDAEQPLCNRPDERSLRNLSRVLFRQRYPVADRAQPIFGVNCDLLSAADRPPVAVVATGLSSVVYRASLLPQLKELGCVDMPSEGHLPPHAETGQSDFVSGSGSSHHDGSFRTP